MKQFNLVEALTDKPVCDSNGNEVKNFRVRTTNDKICAGSFEDYPFVGDVGCYTHSYAACGVYSVFGKTSHDLFMMDEQPKDNQEIALLRERLQKVEDLLGMKDDEEIDPYKEFKDAIAQGKEVQFKSFSSSALGTWESFSAWESNDVIDWTYTVDRYRIKPEVIRYRVYEWKTTWSDKNRLSVVEDEIQESAVSSAPNFVKWLSDWVEVELSA